MQMLANRKIPIDANQNIPINDNHNGSSTNEKNAQTMIFINEEEPTEVVEDQCKDP